MTKSTGHHTRLPADPERQDYYNWLPANRGFYASFRSWLKASGYSPSARNIYSVAARYAIGYLKKPYWLIDPDQDFPLVEAYLQRCPLAPSTIESYHKGLMKLGDYLRIRLNKPAPERIFNWSYYLDGLPDWLRQLVRTFLNYLRRGWLPDHQFERGKDLLSCLTGSLRWMATHFTLNSASDITPVAWLAYLDMRLEKRLSATTMNGELATLQQFLYFLESQGEPICGRTLRVEYLKEGPKLPKDASPAQLRKLYAEIERDAASQHGSLHRMGLLDRAWFLLMLHSGLRTGEVRRMKMNEVDFERRQVRIEQSKGLKDRIVFLTTATISAMHIYLEVRGPADALPKHFFVFRHLPLSPSYCYSRLQNYGERCGVVLTPHQLRHSCATLLLNAGAPVVSVQAILGHKWIDTTLGYARLYDGTLAADYYRAMNEIERQLELVERLPQDAPSPGELVALLDSLRSGTLNDIQANTVQTIRDGLLELARQVIA